MHLVLEAIDRGPKQQRRPCVAGHLYLDLGTVGQREQLCRPSVIDVVGIEDLVSAITLQLEQRHSDDLDQRQLHGAMIGTAMSGRYRGSRKALREDPVCEESEDRRGARCPTRRCTNGARRSAPPVCRA
jgi:hypothetical protein